MVKDGKVIFPWERKEQLTPQMVEIVKLRKQNYRNKEIAEMKGISVRSVEKMCNRILRRTQAGKIKRVDLNQAIMQN